MSYKSQIFLQINKNLTSITLRQKVPYAMPPSRLSAKFRSTRKQHFPVTFSPKIEHRKNAILNYSFCKKDLWFIKLDAALYLLASRLLFFNITTLNENKIFLHFKPKFRTQKIYINIMY